MYMSTKNEKETSEIQDDVPIKADTPSKKVSRIVSFDYLKGWAIIGVLGFHLIGVCYDYKARLKYDVIPIPFILLILVLAFLGSMYTLFVLVSAAVNTISMDKKWKRAAEKAEASGYKGSIMKPILIDQILRGVILISVAYLAEVVFNGMLLDALIPDQPDDVGANAIKTLYRSQILSMIGWGVIFSAIVYLFLRQRGVDRAKIGQILMLLGVAVIIARPIFIEVAKQYPAFWENPEEGWENRNIFRNLWFLFMAQFMMGWFPLLPNLALSFWGTAIGIELADGKITKEFINRLLKISIIVFVAGIVVVFTMDDRYMNNFFVPTAGSFALLGILLYFIEVRGKGTKLAEKTVSVRRFGNLTLSLWCLQFLMVVPLKLFQAILNGVNNTSIRFVDGPVFNGELDGWTTFVLFTIAIILWHGLLVAWEKIDYKGSFEWLTVKLMTGGKAVKSERASLSYLLFNMQSIIPESEGQEYYSRRGKIGMFMLIFIYMLGNVAIMLL